MTAPMPSAPLMSGLEPTPHRHVERLLLVVIVAAGFALRAGGPERLSVEHFDEGVYAANWFCRPPGLPEGVFPRQHLYAPPLLPEVCFWTLFAAGGNPHAVMWINVLAGTLMIPLVWWVARGWFGWGAGLMAAALCAFSDVHIAFSRMVLTDVLLCLFLTTGVGAGVRAIQSGRPGMIAFAGVLAGLAWWTKYNGWLTLAITGAGLAGWLVFGRPAGVSRGVLVLRWGAIAVIAGIVWSPVWWNLQSTGGYAVVARNHARYVVGLSGWWDSLQTQVLRLGYMESGLGIGLTALSATLIVGVARRAGAPPRSVPVVFGSAVWAGAAVVALALALHGMLGASLLLGFLALIPRLRSTESHAGEASQEVSSALPVWTSLAWLMGLLVSLPLYTPYPRLALPLLAGSWLPAAAWLASPRITSANGADRKWMLRCGGMVIVALLTLCLPWSRRSVLPEVAWQDRRGLESLMAPLVAAAASDHAAAPVEGRGGVQAALYVFAEPAVFYHLSALPQRPDFRFLPQPIGNHALLKAGPNDPALATYIITGPHADAVSDDAAEFATAVAAGRLQLVREWPYQMSDLVRLDQVTLRRRPAPTDQPEPGGTPPAESVRLYRVR